MSSTPKQGSTFGSTANPRTGNTGRIPGLDKSDGSPREDTGIGTEVQQKVQDFASGAADMAVQVGDMAREWAGSATHAVEQGYTSTKETITGAYEESIAFMRRHVEICLLAAFVTGALTALCMTTTLENRFSQR